MASRTTTALAAVLSATAVLSGALTATGAAAAVPVPAQDVVSEAGTGPTVKRVPRRALRPIGRTLPTLPVSAPRPAVQPAPVTEVVETVDATPVGATAPLPTGPHAFLNTDNGVPTRWNPCQPVPWHFNAAGAPAGGLAVVQAAVATVAEQTGLRFAYAGTTDAALTGAYLSQPYGAFRPLLIGWTTGAESDLLASGGSSLVGMARVLWTGSYDAAGETHTQIASGVIALNRAHTAPLTGAGSWYTYVLHELGHGVGLGHVDDDHQLMRALIPAGLTTYGDGDRQGLRAVGSTGGCLPSIR